MSADNRFHIGYFADGLWGHNSFIRITEDKSLVIDFVCVRFDKQDPVLIKMAKDNNIDMLVSPNVNSEEFRNKVEEYNSDLFVSMSFNQIFRKDIQEIPPNGIINCHAGKLPWYRGRNILNWALINDEKEFGITVHYVDEGIDTGDIILQQTYPITDKDDYSTLLEKAYTGCPDVLYKAIKQIQEGKAARMKQGSISQAGLYCGMRTAGDEVIDWNQTSREIFNFVRAITKPGPGATSFCKEQKIVIWKVEEIQNAPVYKGVAGQVLVKGEDFFLVKTKDSYVKVVSWDGKVKVGDRFGCLENKSKQMYGGGYKRLVLPVCLDERYAA